MRSSKNIKYHFKEFPCTHKEGGGGYFANFLFTKDIFEMQNIKIPAQFYKKRFVINFLQDAMVKN